MSQTSSSSSSFSSAVPSHPITVGALAGGIVGAALAAALLSILITVLCMRARNTTQAESSRRRRRSHRSNSGNSPGLLAGPEKTVSAIDERLWEQYLPQSLDDRTVQRLLKGLFDQLQLHVENFYQAGHVKVDQDVAATLAELQTPYLPGSVATTITSSRSSMPVIKHCLVYMVTQSIVNTGYKHCLLPTEYTIVASNVNPPDALKANSTAMRQAVSKWRVLTAYINQRPLAKPEARRRQDTAILAMAESFSDAFFLWDADPKDEALVRQHLVELLKTAADVATTLFTQPSSFDLRWEQPLVKANDEQRDLVVVPALMKVADEHGQSLTPAQPLTQAVIERL
ncbi:hypothetical protein LTR08_002761 [Meristemomyces frigidus]|nr:hypothetical protein LTR08_002761 [Meristemomyces frigidus]